MLTQEPEPGPRLRAVGLRPTIGRQTVLGLMLKSEGQPLCCEDLYRQAIADRRSLNVSSIAHALSDLERAGLLIRSTVKDERRLYYRMPEAAPAVTLPALRLERRETLDDPRFARLLGQWLAELGIELARGDQAVIRIEREPA
jgi:Fe2+ or Zn2+ uptake regulation protein